MRRKGGGKVRVGESRKLKERKPRGRRWGPSSEVGKQARSGRRHKKVEGEVTCSALGNAY